MLNRVLIGSVALLGCTHAKFELVTANVRRAPTPVSATAEAQVAADIGAHLMREKDAVNSCFNFLRERIQLREELSVRVTLEVKNERVYLLEIKPKTIADTLLEACIDLTIREWRLPYVDATVSLPLKVNPLMVASHIADAEEATQFHPAE